MDLNLHQMPKFGWQESFIVQANLPRPKEDAAEMRLNPSEDVKISLTFSKHKLVVPWTLLYDSKHKKSLLKLIVTFAHDDFDVISLKSESVCKFKIWFCFDDLMLLIKFDMSPLFHLIFCDRWSTDSSIRSSAPFFNSV